MCRSRRRERSTGMTKRILVALYALAAIPAIVVAQSAPGGPGEMPTWTPAGKDGLGTSITAPSKVWFTLEGGILTEVYYPRVDMADVHALEFAVSDGKRVWIESRDLHHAIERVDTAALVYRQTSTDAAAHITITKTYVTDPARNTLLIDVTFAGPPGTSLYLLYHPALKNSGYGTSATTDGGALIARKEDVASAIVVRGGFAETSNGYAGVNDAYTDLLLHHRLTWTYQRADSGNVIQAGRVAHPAHFTVALGFGATPAAAHEDARASLASGFTPLRAAYARGWHEYLH